MLLSSRLLQFAHRLYRKIFPEVIIRTSEMERLLQKLYPTVNWKNVRFYKGMPWFMDNSFAHAIVLPGTWHYGRIHAYFSSYQPNTTRGLSTIAHESFHVLQYQDMGRGLGLFRGFILYYLADYFELLFKNGFKKGWAVANDIAYRQHPMEIPAYKQDDDFCSFCVSQQTQLQPANIPEQFIKMHCGYQAEHSFPFLLLAILVTLIFSIIKPLTEILFIIVAAPVWILGQLIRGVGL